MCGIAQLSRRQCSPTAEGRGMGMKVGNLMLDGETAIIFWRGKAGNKGTGITQPALNAISAGWSIWKGNGRQKIALGQKDSPLVRFTVTCSDIFKKAG